MTVVVALIALLVLGIAFLFAVAPAWNRHPDLQALNGRYIAHRGLHGLAENTPENSLAAYREAIKHGLAIEIDIHLTADGEVVVFHDDDLKRVCGDDRKVEESTLAQLKSYRLANSDQTIPTLRECLETVNGQVPLLIEFKCVNGNDRALCEKANSILSTYEGLYFVQSFYPFVLRWYKKNRPDVCRGQLAERFKGDALTRQMLGCMLFNGFSRPDFVSYKHQDKRHPFRLLVTALGAFPVGWTFASQEDVDGCKRDFNTYIFEGFLPDNSRQNG